MAKPFAPRLPLAPLFSLMHIHEWGAGRTRQTGVCDALVAVTGVSLRSALRFAAEGQLPERYCDIAAASLGLHPLNIWPEYADLGKVPA